MSVRGDDDTLAGSAPVAASATATDLPELVANRYQIVRWLGGGGMGRVYEAIDTELNERVALKVLRAGLTEDALERFRREVRLTRRVQHKNVARMFDIGDHAGDRFLTMELVDGASLSAELGAPMPWPRLHAIVTQICEGLEAAHEVGIVHRDLKPDNILIERSTDRAVITDFGIARSIDDATVTQDGAIVGTPRYMAPEQLSGQPVDRRADIFALGVMLFELASGKRPWSGDNAIAIAVAQATQPVGQLSSSALPASFNALVMRCLEIEPAQRPKNVSEILVTLRSAAAMIPARASQLAMPTRRPVPTPTSNPAISVAGMSAIPTQASHSSALAVIPLACALGDEYLADGLHEDLTDILSTTPNLRVRPAGLTRAQTEPDPREIGRKLEVDHVVSGSLRRTSPTTIRISARLISVADGFQIWAQRIECAESDLLATSETLAREIANALSTRATANTRPTDPRSVELYLRARAELRRFWGNHAQSAADLLDQAIALSPSSAPIAGARALATVQAWVLQSEPQLYDRAVRALEQGLATGHPEAFLAAAAFKMNTGDPISAVTDLGTAIMRAPMLAQAHEMAGRIVVEIGAAADARAHFETAIALDPSRAPAVSMDLARLDALEGWWERADRRIATLLADSDRSLVALASVSQARLAGWRGDRDVMLAAARRFAPRMGPSASKLIEYLSEATIDNKFDASAWLTFLREFGGPHRPERGQLMGLQMLSEIALLFGHHDFALATLEEANHRNFLDVAILAQCPLFDSIRTNPRFIRVRDDVAARAAQVYAAFRTTAG
jgi:serine/threonine-protein kinase